MPPTDPRTDQQLLDAAGVSDASAFEALYLRHRDWVVRVARRFGATETDAFDVVQDTFSYVLRKLPGLVLTGRMTTLLYPVVKNLTLARRRTAARLRTDDEKLAGLPAPPELATATSGELAAVLTILPDGQRETIVLRFVDGLSLEEIAVALSIPLGTVKSRLHHAIRTLRDDPRTRAYFDQD